MRGVAYPASLAIEARRLNADGGWTAWQIHGIFKRRGLDPCPSREAIRHWIDDSVAERHRRLQGQRLRALTAASARFRLSSNTPEYRLAFIRALTDDGVPAPAIGLVCGRVFGEPLTDHQVRYALKVGRLPSAERDAA